MLKNILLSLALALFCLPALAQTASKSNAAGAPSRGDIAAGYTFLDFTGNGSSQNFSGFSISGAYDFTNWIAAAAEFEFAESTGASGGPNLSNYTIGPRIFHRTGRFTPLVEVLVGGSTATYPPNLSETEWALNVIGAVDINMDRKGRFAVRPELGYLRIGTSPSSNGVHVGGSLVYHF